jgi:NAD(P)-dependent dehydrogenase (short-subunit alcohol dehydrogenase family)
LGKQHALALAARGAKVLVNDLGGDVHGEGGSVSAAQAVVNEIRAAGGEALANGASVTDFEAVKGLLKHPVIFDGRNIYPRGTLERLGFEYHGVGV